MKAQKKSGRNWLIPIIAKKPIDNRVKSGVYQKNKKATALPLPIGISYYRLASTEYYYIDKIMLIKDFPDERLRGLYDKVSLFMRNLFSGELKDNRHFSYGFLTGILRVAKESIFSGLNTLKINSILDNKYSEYLGFTSEEVRKMALYYGVPEKSDKLCD